MINARWIKAVDLIMIFPSSRHHKWVRYMSAQINRMKIQSLSTLRKNLPWMKSVENICNNDVFCVGILLR